MNDKPRYLLVLEPEGSLIPEPVRLRRCLKALLRCYSLRCVSVEEVPKPEEADFRAEERIATGPEGLNSLPQTAPACPS